MLDGRMQCINAYVWGSGAQNLCGISYLIPNLFRTEISLLHCQLCVPSSSARPRPWPLPPLTSAPGDSKMQWRFLQGISEWPIKHITQGGRGEGVLHCGQWRTGCRFFSSWHMPLTHSEHLNLPFWYLIMRKVESPSKLRTAFRHFDLLLCEERTYANIFGLPNNFQPSPIIVQNFMENHQGMVEWEPFINWWLFLLRDRGSSNFGQAAENIKKSIKFQMFSHILLAQGLIDPQTEFETFNFSQELMRAWKVHEVFFLFRSILKTFFLNISSWNTLRPSRKHFLSVYSH